MARQAAEVAADLIKQKGGILGGRKVAIKVEDDAGEPKQGALAATKMVGYKDVVAVVSKRIAILHDNTAFGKGLAENARDALKPMVDSKQVEIVYYDAITPGEKVQAAYLGGRALERRRAGRSDA